MKKSFILHIDSLNCLDELTDEQAGQLFKALREYEETGKHNLTGILRAVFVPFENQLKRDQEKYQRICDRNRENAEKRWGNQDVPDNATGISGIPDVPEHAHSDSKNDSKNKNKNKNKNNNNNSKELQPSVELSEKKEFGNPEINKMLKDLKLATGRNDFKESQQWQRRYAKHFCKMMIKLGSEEFKRRFAEIFSDPFKAKNCNSLKYLHGEMKSVQTGNGIINNVIEFQSGGKAF